MLQKIIIFGLVLCITACQSMRTHRDVRATRQASAQRQTVEDSAPSGPIPRFFKMVIPKVEPRSRYGNPASYRVYGRRYQVMQTAHGYRERGLASWYGTKFHRQRTSSGENYNMYALTAAHRTLPIPTYVRVKNLENGRVAVIRVNDRGPFHAGRIIDLSYGAAVKLGIFPKGTARVEVEAITVSSTQPRKISRASSPRVLSRRGTTTVHHSRQFYVQVAAVTTQRGAEQFKAKLRHHTNQKIGVTTVRGHYLVQVGPFTNRQQAALVQRGLIKQGVKGAYVVSH